MRQRVYTQLIERPADLIWAYIADLCNDSKWRQEITAVELLDGTPALAPATYRESVKWATGHAEVVLRVTESVPGCRVVVESDETNQMSRSIWTFEQHPSGTIVTLAFSLETGGVLHFTEPMIWQLVTHWLERDLGLLQGHLSNV